MLGKTDNTSLPDSDKRANQKQHVDDLLSSLNLVKVVELKDIVLACIAKLIVDQQLQQPYSVEEQYLYDIQQDLPKEPELLWVLLEDVLQIPNDNDQAILILAHQYQLHWLEIMTLALCLAVETDSMVGRVIAYMQAPMTNARPSVGLLSSALSPLLQWQQQLQHTDQSQAQESIKEFNTSVSTCLFSGKAMELGLLQANDCSLSLPEQTLQIPQSVAIAMQGGWQAINGSSIVGMQENVELPEAIRKQAVQHAENLQNANRRALIIRSTSMQEAKTIVQLIAAHMQRMPLLIQSVEIAAEPNAEPIGILSTLAELLPIFSLSIYANDQYRLPELRGYDGPIIVISEPDTLIRSEYYSILNWMLPIPKPDERYLLWSHYLDNQPLARELATNHRHSAGRISELADTARREAELHQHTQQKLEDIHAAAWSHCSDQLSALAEPISDSIDDDAIILNPSTRNDTQLLLQRCRNRETLVDNLGISLTGRYQPGVRSLFVGPSGTGKTLAAAWLATKLAMPLYRVDLATVLSKYIGETEKNLGSLLSKAERSDVILLFDEADSLFGKRTDIKDANDRYANTQTNYLLQRIENYQGIVLLTSNSRSRFDSAFTRRIDMIIDFPAPGPQQRRDLWYSHLGYQHQLTGAQINRLAATLDLCGGHIRNAVLTAAVLANKEQGQIHYEQVIEGLNIEYKKLAKKLPLELSTPASVV